MPITRSTPGPSETFRGSPRIQTDATNKTSASDDEAVIILSEDDTSAPGTSTKKAYSLKKQGTARQRGKRTGTPLIFAPGEVIEISSDEDGPTVVKKPNKRRKSDIETISELEKKVKKLEEEGARIKQENMEMKAAKKAEQSKVFLDISRLEDTITCEVCSLKLWKPYILPECGHTFCQSCLEGWFNRTLSQHVLLYPTYNINAYVVQPMLQDITRFQANRFAHLHQPQPQYTCPKCRVEVKTRPVEDFALKSLVRIVAGAVGETSPKPRKQLGGQRHGGPWHPFFRTQ